MNAPRQGFPLLAKENKARIHTPQVEVRVVLPEQSRHHRLAASSSLTFCSSFVIFSHPFPVLPDHPPFKRESKRRVWVRRWSMYLFYKNKSPSSGHLQTFGAMSATHGRVLRRLLCVRVTPGATLATVQVALPSRFLQLPSFSATVHPPAFLFVRRAPGRQERRVPESPVLETVPESDSVLSILQGKCCAYSRRKSWT